MATGQFSFFLLPNTPSHCSVFCRLISVPLNRLLCYSTGKKHLSTSHRNVVFVLYEK